MIETEYKLELSENEFLDIQKQLKNEGLEYRKSSLKDMFFDVEKSNIKGWNFKRIRVYDDNIYEKTIKKWAFNNKNEPIRLEENSNSNKGELLDLIKESTSRPLELSKERYDYEYGILGYESIISLDKVYIGNDVRYFIEAELKSVPENKSHQIRLEIKNWMLDKFNLEDRPEGQGMMSIVIEKYNEKI